MCLKFEDTTKVRDYTDSANSPPQTPARSTHNPTADVSYAGTPPPEQVYTVTLSLTARQRMALSEMIDKAEWDSLRRDNLGDWSDIYYALREGINGNYVTVKFNGC